MRRVMVSYKVKSERVAEHETLIRAVFGELESVAPKGIRYAAFKHEDGVSFTHLALITAEANPLDALTAFKAFTERIRERCDVPPTVVNLGEVGAYGF
jgi:hypothetical protein